MEAEIEACFAIFEEDVTCPDGTVLPPKYPFDKIWKIRNPGPTVSRVIDHLYLILKRYVNYSGGRKEYI